MPETDTRNFEREFQQLVSELRALPTAAPEDVRARVRALGEPAPPASLWSRFPRVHWRRSLLVLAPACVLALVSAAVIHGVLNSGEPRPAAQPAAESGTAKDSQLFENAQPQTAVPGAAVGGARLQDYDASMTLRVKDVDDLSVQTNEAMRLARSYGGFVVSLQQSSAVGQPGRADLMLRVPVARVEQALMELAGLGTVIDRRLSIRDLELTVRQQRAEINRLRLFIARASEQLKGDLPADVRLRLQLQLEQARADLNSATRSNRATLREAALSEVALALTTQKAVGATKSDSPGRVERAAREAGSFLAAAGAVALFLLIVLSPLIVLSVAALWGTRTYRRREERRLLSAT
jgi:Domain of unknown function (DUF4349)